MSAPIPIPYSNSTYYLYVRVDQGDTMNSRFRIVGYFFSYEQAITAYGLDSATEIDFRELRPEDEYYIVRLFYSHVNTNSLNNYGRMRTALYESEISKDYFFVK